MANQKYYLTENEYEFFIRIFPNAKQLSWVQTKETVNFQPDQQPTINSQQPEEKVFWYIEIDLKNISESDRLKLGDDYKACLDRLEQQARTHPDDPAPATAVSDYGRTVPNHHVFSSYRKKNKSIKSVIGAILADGLLIAMIIYGANFVSEAKNSGIPPESIRNHEHRNAANSESAALNKKNQFGDNIAKSADIETDMRNRIFSKNPISEDSLKKTDGFMELVQKTVAIPSQAEDTDEQVIALLDECETHFNANRLTTGSGGTALECYQKVLEYAPGNPDAQVGLKKIENQYVQWAETALTEKNLDKVRQYLEGLETVNPESSDLARLKQEIEKLRSEE